MVKIIYVFIYLIGFISSIMAYRTGNESFFSFALMAGIVFPGVFIGILLRPENKSDRKILIPRVVVNVILYVLTLFGAGYFNLSLPKVVMVYMISFIIQMWIFYSGKIKAKI